MAPSKSHDMVNAPFQTSIGLGVSTSVAPTSMYSPRKHTLISDDECCKVLFSEAMSDECFCSADYNEGVNMVDLSRSTSFLCQLSLPTNPDRYLSACKADTERQTQGKMTN